jgi:hypothetical protein
VYRDDCFGVQYDKCVAIVTVLRLCNNILVVMSTMLVFYTHIYCNLVVCLLEAETLYVYTAVTYNIMDMSNATYVTIWTINKYKILLLLLLFSTYSQQPSRLIVRFGLDIPTFTTRHLHACHHLRAPSSGRWNCGQKSLVILSKCRFPRYI